MYKKNIKNARKILTRYNCTFEEAVKLTSKTSAYRLFSFRIDKLTVNYNKKEQNINYKNIQFDIKDAYRIAGYVISRYIDTRHFYFDDIVSEAVANFLLRSGNCEGKASELSQTAFYTMLDFKKRKLFQEQAWANAQKYDQFDKLDKSALQEFLNSQTLDSLYYEAFRRLRLKKSHYRCEKCGIDAQHAGLQIHHIIPRRVKPVHTIENTAVLCKDCHNRCEFFYSVASIKKVYKYKEIYNLFLSYNKSEIDVKSILKSIKLIKEN